MKCLKPISNTLLIKFFKEQLGKNNISDIGDGTITGAIKYLKDNKSTNNDNTKEIENNTKEIKAINDKIGTTDISTYGKSITHALFSIADFQGAISDMVSKNSFDLGNIQTEVKKIKAKTLWTNNNITNPIGNVAYNLEDNLYNYNFYCMIYSEDTSCNSVLSTGMIFITLNNARLVSFDTDKLKINKRIVTVGKDKIAIGNCLSIDMLNKTSVQSNSYCVPLCLVGYHLPLN